jgi:hypothetical protein
MRKALIALLAVLAIPTASAAQSLGTVTKTLRPQLSTFDEKGNPLGRMAAKDLKLPAPITGFGVSNSVGVRAGDKVVYLRGLDVQTTGVRAACAPVQGAARAAGTAYAASNMGLGAPTDCGAAK